MIHKNKSILDGMAVKEDGFPLSSPPSKATIPMQIVGHCPKCGKPIYGYVRLPVGEEPSVKSSCSCSCSFTDTVQTK